MEGFKEWKEHADRLLSEASQKWKEHAGPLGSQAQDYIQQVPPTQICAALAVFLLTSMLFLFGRIFKHQKSHTILLSGLSGSGKTVLFYKLWDGSAHQGKVKPVRLIDVPGHSRLRAKIDEFLPLAAGVIFVVDALDFIPNLRAASEYLYDILTKECVVKKKIPVLVLCNKTDKITAHTKEFIRKQMEKEIDKLRASRSALSAADISNDFTLGVLGEAFSFTQCQNKVTAAEAAGITGDIIQVEQFIRDHVKA